MTARAETPDPLSDLPLSESTAALLSATRDEIDAVLWDRGVRAKAAEVAAASVMRGARDSAAIDGADTAVVDDSPMGRILGNAQVLTARVPALVDTWATSPLQVLAELHAIAALGFTSDEERGRPRSTDDVRDPLNMGQLPPAAVIGHQLAGLAEVITMSTSPALLVAAIVHGELSALRPFEVGSGLVARASVRLVMASKGIDPSLFTIPEHGMFELGRPAYVSAIREYSTGTAEGINAYVTWFATALAMGAKAVEI
ncbi:MAG: oxidoreductase [Actinomycetes bacterium]